MYIKQANRMTIKNGHVVSSDHIVVGGRMIGIVLFTVLYEVLLLLLLTDRQ